MDPNPPNYSSWTNTNLIKRVTDLEARLRTYNELHKHSRTTTPTPPRKKQKKPKPFDASRYNTRLIALKFAYLGKRYNGFEHHANNTTPLPTVEEELWKALMKTKLILPDFKGGPEDEVCWEGCDYSKCGRTDKGVSAFGQVIGLRVRSSRPKQRDADVNGSDSVVAEDAPTEEVSPKVWDSIADELPYLQLLNRVLPSDIRVLAWCPNPPESFSARFSCKERRYRYFFTNPAYAPVPGEDVRGGNGGAWLNLEAMQQAAKKLEGLHDFRNLCKVDPSKQISDFRRRIFHADVRRVSADEESAAFLSQPPFNEAVHDTTSKHAEKRLPAVYYFEVRGSAFLWHQVRHMVAILFLVGQGYEDASIVDKLLDIQQTPARPIYDMAADTPLVLWDCIFPGSAEVSQNDHDSMSSSGYNDAMEWLYVGDTQKLSTPRSSISTEDRKYGRMSLMEDLWSSWQTRKLDELLAAALMNTVARQGNRSLKGSADAPAEGSDRIFDGSETPRTVGQYVPLMNRERLDPPEVVNARYAARKGIRPRSGSSGVPMDVDE